MEHPSRSLRANVRAFLEYLIGLVKRGLLDRDQVTQVWNPYAIAAQNARPHVGEAKLVWELLLGEIGAGVTVFAQAMEAWRRFLETGILPTSQSVGNRLGQPNAVAGIRPIGSADPIVTMQGPLRGYGFGGIDLTGQGWDLPGLFSPQQENGVPEAQCCVVQFKYPIDAGPAIDNLGIRANRLHVNVGFKFEAISVFSPTLPCNCECCQFRQYVSRRVQYKNTPAGADFAFRRDVADKPLPANDDVGADKLLQWEDVSIATGGDLSVHRNDLVAVTGSLKGADEAIKASVRGIKAYGHRDPRSDGLSVGNATNEGYFELTDGERKDLVKELEKLTPEKLKEPRRPENKYMPNFPKKSNRGAGCAYSMRDAPSVPLLEGGTVVVQWDFMAVIWKTGECGGTNPKKRFSVRMEATLENLHTMLMRENPVILRRANLRYRNGNREQREAAQRLYRNAPGRALPFVLKMRYQLFKDIKVFEHRFNEPPMSGIKRIGQPAPQVDKRETKRLLKDRGVRFPARPR